MEVGLSYTHNGLYTHVMYLHTHTHTLSQTWQGSTPPVIDGAGGSERVAGRKGVCWLLASCVLLYTCGLHH